jgi:hypothetical protein
MTVRTTLATIAALALPCGSAAGFSAYDID